MQVTIRGWSRDHGSRVLLEADVDSHVREGGGTYKWKETYIEVIHMPRRGLKPRPYKVHVTGSAELNLNGGYMVELELSRSEIARLFQLTHGVEEGRHALQALEEAARSLRALYGNETA